MMDHFSTARSTLLVHYPFYGHIACSLKAIKTDAYETAATDGVRVFWNEEFFDRLDRGGRAFVVAHEVLHAVVMTMERRGSRDPHIWNLASDYAINGMLVESGLKMPKVNEETIGLYDHSYAGKSAEQIYDELIKDPKKCKGLGTLDKHLTSKPTEEEVRRLKSAVSQAALQPGSIPKGVIRRILDIVGDQLVDWRSMLASKVMSKKQADYDWSIPDQAVFSSGITIPSLSSEDHIDIGIAIDTSGSISDQDARIVLSEIGSLCAAFKSWTIHIVSHDTQVHNPQTYTSEDGVDIQEEYELMGGGGTLFRPTFEHFRDNPVDVLVYFTDGYGEGWCEDFSGTIDTLWVINNLVKVPSWGTYTCYDRYQER